MSNTLKVALTHDVDRTVKTYQYITHLYKALKNKDFNDALYHVNSIKKRNSVYWNFDEIISIENQYGIKSTFFFLIETIPFKFYNMSNWKLSLGRYDINEPRIKEIMNYLDENGWEIGLHGSYLSYQNKYLLKSEKVILEEQIGHPVIGIRQHYLNLNEKTWSFQKEAGFNYDTSWGYTNTIGFKDNRVNPFHPYEDKFTVFPLTIMDSCFMNTANRKEMLEDIMKICIRNESILVLNWHSNNFNEKEYPGYKKAYCEVIESCLEKNASFSTLSYFYNNL